MSNRRYWVVSPNAQNDGKVDYWLKRSIGESKVFVGYDNDKKHGNTFENTINIDDCIIIAKGAKSDRKLYIAGLVSSLRKQDVKDEIFYRNVDYLINENDFEFEGIQLNSDNAWGESSNPGTIYELKKSNESDKLVIDKINTIIKLKLDMKTIKERIKLLKYKKQIILQGPPGTGKTRMAKEIAKDLSIPIEITNDDILKIISPGIVIKTPTGSKYKFKILEFGKDYIKVKPDNAKHDYNVSFSEIKESYKNKHWELPISENNSNGNASYKIGLAKYIFENIDSGNLKIIQFHPAYSYEDFVRGISVKGNGVSLVYKTENKNLAKFAKSAKENYDEFLKTKTSLTENDWTIENAKLYLDHVKQSISDSGKDYFLFKSSAYISKVNNNSFKYNSANYGGNGFEMSFDEFYKYCLDKRTDIEEKKNNTEYANSMLHKAEVGNFLMEDFWAFLDNQPAFQDIPKVELLNYILIIDEINRANLPAVLGELIYALEYRGEMVEGMYDIEGDNTLILPPNLYIIGTMNTADRSVSHIDYAIRRRFAFVEVLPEIEPVHPLVQEIFKEVSKLFIHDFDEYARTKIIVPASETLSADFRPEDVWIGHSYFICKKDNSDENLNDSDAKQILNSKLKYEVLPIIKEYVKDGILQDNDKTKSVLLKLTQWI